MAERKSVKARLDIIEHQLDRIEQASRAIPDTRSLAWIGISIIILQVALIASVWIN